jgi:hypothetical protein
VLQRPISTMFSHERSELARVPPSGPVRRRARLPLSRGRTSYSSDTIHGGNPDKGAGDRIGASRHPHDTRAVSLHRRAHLRKREVTASEGRRAAMRVCGIGSGVSCVRSVLQLSPRARCNVKQRGATCVPPLSGSARTLNRLRGPEIAVLLAGIKLFEGNLELARFDFLVLLRLGACLPICPLWRPQYERHRRSVPTFSSASIPDPRRWDSPSELEVKGSTRCHKVSEDSTVGKVDAEVVVLAFTRESRSVDLFERDTLLRSLGHKHLLSLSCERL